MPLKSRQGSAAPERFRVLVVDDSPSIRHRVVEKLRTLNLEIT